MLRSIRQLLYILSSFRGHYLSKSSYANDLNSPIRISRGLSQYELQK